MSDYYKPFPLRFRGRMSSATWKHSEKTRRAIERRVSDFIKAAGLRRGQAVVLYAEDYDAIARLNFNGVRVHRGDPRPRAGN